MATMENTSQTPLVERVVRLETEKETERPHLATKADLERHTRLLVMWFVATQIALFVALYTALTGSLG